MSALVERQPYSKSYSQVHSNLFWRNPNQALTTAPVVKRSNPDVVSQVKAIRPQVKTCSLTIVNAPRPTSEMILNGSQLNFLHPLFCAKLGSWIQSFYGVLLEQNNTSEQEGFKTQVLDTELEILPDRINLRGEDQAKLMTAIRELAKFIYSSTTNLSLEVECDDIALKQTLQQVVDEVYLEVNAPKEEPSFATYPYNADSAEHFKPSAPLLSDLI